jgi:phosphomethylpyrimidine synthase
MIRSNPSSEPVSNEAVTRDPFPASTKIYRPGKLHSSVQVAMREISLSPTPLRDATGSKGEPRPNDPVDLFDRVPQIMKNV